MSQEKRLRRLISAALMAALIFLTTAYVLHIPVGAGYVHLGDAAIYVAAVLLPDGYALAAAVMGATLADLLTGAAVWAIPTAVVKAAMTLPFTARGERLLCRRNRIAPLIAGGINVVGYAVADWLIFGSVPAALTAAVPNGLQSAVAAAAFYGLAAALERTALRR